jgi:hypothetical protein
MGERISARDGFGVVRISFDLDDTLVPCGRPMATVAPASIKRALCSEPLRAGAPKLLRELVAAGHEVGVYTSSDRARARVRLDFWTYGVALGHVVNKTVHDRWWRSLDRRRRAELAPCVKFPPAFGIDLLVDDSEAIALRGRVLGFEVVVVDPGDPDWRAKVLQAVDWA